MADLSPQTREEHFLARIAGDSTAIVLEPQTRIEHFLQRIIDNGGPSPGPGGAVSSVNGKTGAVVLYADDVGAAQDSLKLTATPTAGPSGTTLMSGTWSGATWEQVATAIQNSRLIQIDVANIGKITLLYNLGAGSYASSNAFSYTFDGILYNVYVGLRSSDGDNLFYLTIINARTDTVTFSGTVQTFTPSVNKIYNFGVLTSLTISNPPATGAYSIVFTSGSTPTVTTFPATILGLDDFAAEADTVYEINVLDGRAVYNGWPLPVSE